MVGFINLYADRSSPTFYTGLKGSRICSLTDAISCIVTEELNKTFYLEMEYYGQGVGASELSIGRIIGCKATPFDNYEQLFRICQVKKTTKQNIKVLANHISYDLSKYIVRPIGFDTTIDPETRKPVYTVPTGDMGFIKEWLIGEYASIYGYPTDMEVSPPAQTFPFELVLDPLSGSPWNKTVAIKFTDALSVREWIGKSDIGILSLFNCDIKFGGDAQGRRITFCKHRGKETADTRIIYGKNLKDFNDDTDGEKITTGFLPCYRMSSNVDTNTAVPFALEASEYAPGQYDIHYEPFNNPDYTNPIQGENDHPIIKPEWGFSLSDDNITLPFVVSDTSASQTPLDYSKVSVLDVTSEVDDLISSHHEVDGWAPTKFSDVVSYGDETVRPVNPNNPTPQEQQMMYMREMKRQWRNRFIGEVVNKYIDKGEFLYGDRTFEVDYFSINQNDNIQLGDSVEIYGKTGYLMATKRATKIEYDALRDRYNRIEFGKNEDDYDLASVVANTSIEKTQLKSDSEGKNSSFESDVKSLVDKYLSTYLVSASVSGNTLTIVPSSGQNIVYAPSSPDTWRNIYLNNHEFLTNATTSGYLKFASTYDDNSGRMSLSINGSSETGGKKLDFGLYYDLSYFARDNDYDHLTLNSTWLNSIATKATTLAGYGISDAYIQNGVITLGSNTITPLTSHQTVTAYNPTLAWGTQSAVASIGGTALNVTMPSNPLTFPSPSQASDENKVIKYAGMDAYTWDFVSWTEISNRPTIPTICLNGTNTTSADFYAPTGSGSDGSILRSNGSGHAPTWSTGTYLRRQFSYISASGESEVEISQSNGIVLAAGTNISLNKSEATNKTTITFNVSASPTPDPPAPCLIEGTQIKMADGSTKAIEDVKTGDEILSWDVNANTFTTAFVISQSRNGRSLEFMSHLFDDGSYIVTYGVHMVYNETKGYPIDIAEFKIGDTTINADGDVISYIGNNRYRVRRKDSVNYYALTTSNNLYFAGDILNGMTVFAKYRAADKLGLDIPDSLKLVCQEQEKIIDDAAGFQKSDAYLREISAALKQKSVLTKRINEAKAYLDKTDYYDNKYVEGALSEEEWAKTIADRATMRDTINAAEPDLAAAESQIKDIQAKYYKSTKGKRSRFKSFCALDNANLDIYRAWLQKGDSNEE